MSNMSTAAQIRSVVKNEDARHMHFSAYRDEKGALKPRILFPNSIVKVQTKKELLDLLESYANQEMWTHLVPDSNFARRWYVEKVRPAIRFYCMKFGLEVPSWMKDETYFTSMSPTRKLHFFGTEELKPITFKKLGAPKPPEQSQQAPQKKAT